MGRATEQLAERLGEGVGGLLNATFGNAAELIISLAALRAGLHDVVKASIAGSIVGNILLVLGASMLAGGMRHTEQHFNPAGARSQGCPPGAKAAAKRSGRAVQTGHHAGGHQRRRRRHPDGVRFRHKLIRQRQYWVRWLTSRMLASARNLGRCRKIWHCGCHLLTAAVFMRKDCDGRVRCYLAADPGSNGTATCLPLRGRIAPHHQGRSEAESAFWCVTDIPNLRGRVWRI